MGATGNDVTAAAEEFKFHIDCQAVTLCNKQGRFIPPQCYPDDLEPKTSYPAGVSQDKFNATKCRLLFHGKIFERDGYWIENMILRLKLNLVIQYSPSSSQAQIKNHLAKYKV